MFLNKIFDQEWLLNIHKIKLQSDAEQRHQRNLVKDRKAVLNKKHNLVRR